MVVDYRELNDRTKRDSHPIPNPKDMLFKVAGFTVYCKLDLMSGFWQILIEKICQDKTGVVTPETLFFWFRIPFGVRNGPPAFQRAINVALAAHKLTDIIAGFIDDLATGGVDHKQAAANTARMFAMLRDYNLKAGAEKVFLGLEEVQFLGYTLKGGNISPDGEKVAAIERLLPPQTRTEVRAFLGLTGYYREFVHRYSHIARPLSRLLEEDRPWEWGREQEAAFQRLKNVLTTAPILANPDPHRPF